MRLNLGCGSWVLEVAAAYGRDKVKRKVIKLRTILFAEDRDKALVVLFEVFDVCEFESLSSHFLAIVRDKLSEVVLIV
jgi:hypothetical protein